MALGAKGQAFGASLQLLGISRCRIITMETAFSVLIFILCLVTDTELDKFVQSNIELPDES